MKHLRRVVGLLGVLALAAAAVGTAAHYLGRNSSMVARVAAFTPLLVLCAGVAIALLLLARQRVLALLAVAVLALGAWTQLPLFAGATGTTASAETTDGPTVRLFQANIALGQADAGALVQTVTDERVDVLTVIELTPDAARRLSAAGLDAALPHSFLRPREGGGGTGIYSRFPLTDGTVLPDLAMYNLEAVADIPGTEPTAIYALHPVPPYPQPAWKWAGELRKLRDVLDAQTRPLIVGADFNSTYDHRQYRQLLRGSSDAGQPPLLDADEYLGAGIVATYPADRWFPAVVAIDKVLTRGGTPLSFRRVDLPGSDHHGVLGDIRL